MATDTSAVTNHFPKPQDGFTTTTSGSISSGAATVGLNSTGSYANGDIFVGIIEPGTTGKEQTFTGVVDTSGVQITGVKWTRGTNVAHSAGVTVVDYASATHLSMVSKGILVEHNQDGTHDETIITSRTEDSTPAAGDYVLTSDVSASNALKKVTRTNLLAGAIGSPEVIAGLPVQIVNSVSTAVSTGTTVIPVDDTIPQITEGDQYMTLAITPKSTTNTLVIQVNIMLSNTVAGRMTVALFQDATANALAAAATHQAATTVMTMVTLTHTMAAGTTSSTTFRVRAGCNAAGTTTFNGESGARLYGAITKSSIVITEYKS